MLKEIQMKIDLTTRGFIIVEFKDFYNFDCSIQESSLATEDCIWLGVNEKRMHLNREMVQALLPLLFKFVETGGLE